MIVTNKLTGIKTSLFKNDIYWKDKNRCVTERVWGQLYPEFVEFRSFVRQ